MALNPKDVGLLCAPNGTQVLGSLDYEAPVNLTSNTFIGACSVGAFSYINQSGVFSHTSIGRFCSVADWIVCGPGQHNPNFFSNHPFVNDPNDNTTGMKVYRSYEAILSQRSTPPSAIPRCIAHVPITIGHDVWIGTRAIIMSGVNIGHGAVIAAGAIVTKDVAPYTIVGGVPAKPIRKRFSEDLIADMLDLQWWNYDMTPVSANVNYGEPAKVVAFMRSAIRSGRVTPFTPARFRVLRDGTACSISAVH